MLRAVFGVSGVTLLVLLSPPPESRTQAGPPPAPDAPVVLTVGGKVARPYRLTADEFARLPRQSVRARDHRGNEGAFEGVALSELLKKASVPSGPDLRGPGLAHYLVVEASDGYRVVFALPELDPASTDRVVLLADRRDGKPLAEGEGPLRIIVPGEKRHSRWVRQVVTLKVFEAPGSP